MKNSPKYFCFGVIAITILSLPLSIQASAKKIAARVKKTFTAEEHKAGWERMIADAATKNADTASNRIHLGGKTPEAFARELPHEVQAVYWTVRDFGSPVYWALGDAKTSKASWLNHPLYHAMLAAGESPTNALTKVRLGKNRL